MLLDESALDINRYVNGCKSEEKYQSYIYNGDL